MDLREIGEFGIINRIRKWTTSSLGRLFKIPITRIGEILLKKMDSVSSVGVEKIILHPVWGLTILDETANSTELF